MAADEHGLERQVIEWLLGDDVGVSSMTIVAANLGVKFRGSDHPYDLDDLSRCVKVLDQIPELSLQPLRELSPSWRALVDGWNDLVATYREEAPAGECPKAAAMMRNIRAAGEAADAK